MTGRPKLKDAERREKPLRIRLSGSERKRIDTAARKRGLLASTWARMVLLEAAEKDH